MSHRLGAVVVAILLALATVGCQALLGIKDPVVGGAPDGAVAGGDASGPVPPADGRAGTPDGQAGNSDASQPGIYPRLRLKEVMAYDQLRHRLIVFGGVATATFLNDTWEWDGATWKNVTPAQGNPAPRANAMMAFDAALGEVVLFGGYDQNNNPLGDTWEWDGARWRNVTPPSNNPAARSGGAMVYDSTRDAVELFGGTTSTTSLDDTWQWDGSSWTDVTPASGNPPARNGFASAYDAADRISVLFGGLGQGETELGDTWVWNGASWTDATPTAGAGPSARDGEAMAYDADTARVVMFGGSDAAGHFLDGTWERDSSGWSQIPASGAPTQWGYAAAYDPDIRRVLFYGGGRDLWEWDGTNWMDVKQ